MGTGELFDAGIHAKKNARILYTHVVLRLKISFCRTDSLYLSLCRQLIIFDRSLCFGIATKRNIAKKSRCGTYDGAEQHTARECSSHISSFIPTEQSPLFFLCNCTAPSRRGTGFSPLQLGKLERTGGRNYARTAGRRGARENPIPWPTHRPRALDDGAGVGVLLAEDGGEPVGVGGDAVDALPHRRRVAVPVLPGEVLVPLRRRLPPRQRRRRVPERE